MRFTCKSTLVLLVFCVAGGTWVLGQGTGSGDATMLARELEECRSGLQVAWDEMEAMKASVAETEAELAAVQSQRAGLEKSLGEREALLRRLKSALLQQRERVGELEADALAAAERAAGLEAELASARGETGEDEPPTRSQKRKIRSLTEKVEKLESTVSEQRAALDNSEREQKAGAKAMRELERDKEKVAKQVAKQVEELDRTAATYLGQRDEFEVLWKQRGDEIKDLKRALAERDALLKRQPVPPEARGEVTSTEEPPAEVVEAETTPVEETTPEEPGSPYKLIVEGNRELRSDNVDKAQELFNKALASDPELVGARLGLAACHYTRGNFREAKRLIQQLLSEDPRNPQALGQAGIIAWREGDLRQASKRLDMAVRIAPNDPELQNYAGIILHARNKHDDAVRALQKAVELDPTYGEAMFNLAVLLATGKTPQVEEARTHYEKAVSLGSERDEKLEQILNP